MDKPLAGRVALVTGASRGIGAAIATLLADRGADVAVGYSASGAQAEAVVRELRGKGVRAQAFRADQGEPSAVERLVQTVAEQFGRLDILVNNAGVFITGKVGEDPTLVPAFERQWRINVGGVVAAVRAAVPFLTQGGRIITIGSVAGSRVSFAGVADYAATKAAVAAYTRGWARDFGPNGITVNAVQPGPVDTDMNPADGAFAAVQRDGTALGRYGKPAEIAAAVGFLASPEASFITGATLDVDGGFNA